MEASRPQAPDRLEDPSRRGPSLPEWTRSWLADSAVLLVSQALTLVATSAAAIVIARQLSPRDWGIFAGFLALSSALTFVIQFGTATWLLRELSRAFASEDADRAAEHSLVDAALVLTGALGGAVVGVGLVVAAARQLEPPVMLALTLLLAYGGLYASSNVIESHLRATRRVGRVAAATILEKALLIAGVSAAAVARGGVAAMAVAYVVAAFVRITFVHRSVFQGAGGRRRPSRRQIARVFRASAPFAMTSASLAVIPKLDVFLLLLVSAASAGYFALGDRLVGAAVIFPEVLSITLYPFFARRSSRDGAPWLLAFAFAAAGAALAAPLIVFAPDLVPLVFGSKYDPAVPAVRVLLLALPLVFAIGPLRVYAFSRGEERRVVLIALTTALAGSVGIVTGQLAAGVVAAAAAYCLRYLLFAAGLVYVSAIAARYRPHVGTQTNSPLDVVSP